MTQHCMEVDEETGVLTINAEKTDKTIYQCLDDYLSPMGGITVCLSGGLDSQFTLWAANKYNDNVDSVTFVYTWNGAVVNLDDVAQAKIVADRFNVPHRYKYFALEDIFNNLSEISAEHRCISPQLSAHIYSIKSLPTHRTVLVGGDVPYIGETPNGTGFPANRMWSKFFKVIIHPYYASAPHVIKDLFMATPELFYTSILVNRDVVENTGKTIDTYHTRKPNFFEYKTLYYREIMGDDYIPVLAKRTGFESLKHHMAMTTGNYDEFDLLFRKELENAGSDWYDAEHLFAEKVNYPEAVYEALSYIDDQIKETGPSICNGYAFDW